MQLNLLKSFSAYSFVGFFGAAVNFLILPILSHYLSPADYGTLSIFNAYVTLAIPLISLVASGLIIVEYYKITNKKDFASIFSSIQLIPLIPFLLFLLACLLFKNELCLLLELPLDSADYIYLIPVLSLLTIYNESLLSLLVAKKESNLFLLVNIIKVVFEVSLTCLFVIYFKWGWQGRILSWLIVTILLTIVTTIYFNANNLFTTNIKIRYFKAGIVYGLPLILHTIGKFVINQSDRLFIAKMVSIDEVGVYNIGYQIGSIIMIFITAFQNLYTPFLYERLANLNDRVKFEIVQFSYFIILILFIGVLALTLISPFLFDWLIDKRFNDGAKYVFWICLSYFFWGIYIILSGHLYFYKENKYLGYLAILNVCLNLVLNYFLIIRFGAIGAAYATCISFFLVFIFISFVSNKISPMPWFNPEVLKFKFFAKQKG